MPPLAGQQSSSLTEYRPAASRAHRRKPIATPRAINNTTNRNYAYYCTCYYANYSTNYGAINNYSRTSNRNGSSGMSNFYIMDRRFYLPDAALTAAVGCSVRPRPAVRRSQSSACPEYRPGRGIIRSEGDAPDGNSHRRPLSTFGSPQPAPRNHSKERRLILYEMETRRVSGRRPHFVCISTDSGFGSEFGDYVTLQLQPVRARVTTIY